MSTTYYSPLILRGVEPSAARIAGTTLISIQRFVQAQHGDGAYARLLEHVPAEHASALEGIAAPIRWYPTLAVVAVIDAARDVFGQPDFAERLGEASADEQMHTLYRFLLRFTSPSWLMTRGVSRCCPHPRMLGASRLRVRDLPQVAASPRRGRCTGSRGPLSSPAPSSLERP